MTLKTSTDKISPVERKKDSELSERKIYETNKNNVLEYTKKSKVNNKRINRKHRGISTKINKSFIFSSSGISNTVLFGMYSLYNMPILPIPYTSLPYYPQYLTTSLAYNLSCIVNTTVNPYNVSGPVCSFPRHPSSVVPPNLLSTQVCPYPYPATTVVPESVLPVVSPLVDSYSSVVTNFSANTSLGMYSEAYEESLIGEPVIAAGDLITNQKQYLDPTEFYLTLPRELFPTAKMLAVDPNLIIDEFCRHVDILKHTSWILDLEFGVPRTPVTRPIATYDVQFNSIHCKNTPGAIHPGFESCSQDFKKAFLFYYDCVISAWYRGYMMMHSDGSVANFQNWLQFPMQSLGMCWP